VRFADTGSAGNQETPRPAVVIATQIGKDGASQVVGDFFGNDESLDQAFGLRWRIRLMKQNRCFNRIKLDELCVSHLVGFTVSNAGGKSGTSRLRRSGRKCQATRHR